ncbi:MAG: DUF3102 domain-containing protein [Acidobacteriota bacterium]
MQTEDKGHYLTDPVGEWIAKEIHYHEEQARQGAGLAIQHKATIGGKLIEARKLLSRDDYRRWAQQEFGWSRMHLNNHMRLYRAVNRGLQLPAGTSLRMALAARTAFRQQKGWRGRDDWREWAQREFEWSPAHLRRHLQLYRNRLRVAGLVEGASLRMALAARAAFREQDGWRGHDEWRQWAKREFGWEERHPRNHLMICRNRHRVAALVEGASLRMALGALGSRPGWSQNSPAVLFCLPA